MTSKEIKRTAIHHLKKGDKNILFIGQNEKPEKTFDNPQLLPQMFPHLAMKHKKWLLMYHDKRFQSDPVFALIAFNIEQMSQANIGGYLMTRRRNMDKIADCIHKLNETVLENIISRLKNNESVKPQTDEEKNCFMLLKHLDSVASFHCI